MTNLDLFCAMYGPYEAPFSHDDYTYATNKYIMVRVPLRADVPPSLDVPAGLSSLFCDHPDVVWRPLRKVKLPPIVSEDTSMYIGDVLFNVKYVRLLATLPAVEVPTKINPEKQMPFRFDGGDGVLMPLLRKVEHHVEVSA
jgi:hypothetical protein